MTTTRSVLLWWGMLFAFTTATAQVQQSYQLQTTQGWNLLGNSVDKSINIATMFGDTNKVTSVWKWDNTGNRWMFYAPSLSTAELQSYISSNGFGLLTTIEGGEGYWVNAKTATDYGTQTGLGVISPKLGAGWNLVASGGTADSSTVSVEMFSHISKKVVDVTSVWQWAGMKWNFYAPALMMDGTLSSYQTANKYGPITGSVSGVGKGFWVKGDAAKVVTPIPVLRSSHENKMAAGNALGPQKMPNDKSGNARAFADFLQDGSYTVVVNTLEYNNSLPLDKAILGHIYFLKQVNGQWIDITTLLLTNNTGCIHPRKAMVADLNGDGKPDVILACHGYDSPPYPGEQQRVLMSQADGTYENVALPTTAYAHGGSVADVNGNGYSDIIYTDTSIRQSPFYLVNKKDGTFTEDKTRMPQSVIGKGIYSLEFIDVKQIGQYDLWVGGLVYFDKFPQASIAPTFYYNDKTNHYSDISKLSMTTVMKNVTPLDIVVKKNAVYMLHIQDQYVGVQIEKYELTSGIASVLYTHNGSYSADNSSTWFDFIVLYKDSLVPMDANYQISIPIP